MPRIILLVALGFILWYLWQHLKGLQKKPPQERKAALWRFIFIALFGVTLGLVITGRAHWLAAAFAGLLPLAKSLMMLGARSIPLLHLWRRHSNSEFGPRIKTPYLDVKINLRNGHIDGKVLQGEFAEQLLSELDRPKLDQLLEVLRGTDREGTMLLQAYIIRRFGPSGENSQQGHNYQQQAPASRSLTKTEAWQILGLEPEADEATIIKAHKRLIQKLHPDRGGNDYLASKVNAAKDLLLKGL
ncbi:MAG: molecular chaperone DnaJ [Porticoccaceae bacterium]|nr:molecular chaperone DnaJ [Porticoccaceae bacterium]